MLDLHLMYWLPVTAIAISSFYQTSIIAKIKRDLALANTLRAAAQKAAAAELKDVTADVKAVVKAA